MSLATPAPTGQLPLEEEAPPPHRRFGRRRQLIAASTVVVLAGAGIGIYEATQGGGSSSGSVLAISTEKYTVTTGDMTETVSASGTIEPATDADLTFGVSGKVTAVDVSTGQKVTKGQVLATVDPAALQDDLDAAQATLSADQARLSSDESSGASTSQIDSDQAAVTSAQSQLSTAQTDLADAKLTSTINGTVASVGLAVGDEVTGSGSGSSGSGGSNALDPSGSSGTSDTSGSSEDIVVVATGSYVVSTSVDDTEVGEIQNGDQATITPSNSTTNVYGTVSSVGLVASSSDSSVASFPVDIAVTGSPGGLYPGASASVSITVKELTDVTEVPTAAISYNSSGQATVTEVKGGSDVTVPVTTGASVDGDTQITSGVSPGDVILERVVKFNAPGVSRRLLGGSGGGSTRTGGFPGGGGGFPGGGGGFPGGGGGGVQFVGGGGGG